MDTVLISACLLGEACRWHGRAVAPSGYVRRFIRENPEATIVPVCPEVLGGLPVPRPPVKTVRGRVFETCARKEERYKVTGADVTEAFVAGAEATLEIAKRHGCSRAILCRNSPSCARGGITGRLLVANGIEVENTF